MGLHSGRLFWPYSNILDKGLKWVAVANAQAYNTTKKRLNFVRDFRHGCEMLVPRLADKRHNAK
jgi:hypothetical protein